MMSAALRSFRHRDVIVRRDKSIREAREDLFSDALTFSYSATDFLWSRLLAFC